MTRFNEDTAVKGGRKQTALAKRNCLFLHTSNERRHSRGFGSGVASPAAGFQNPDGKPEGSPSGAEIPAAPWARIKVN